LWALTPLFSPLPRRNSSVGGIVSVALSLRSPAVAFRYSTFSEREKTLSFGVRTFLCKEFLQRQNFREIGA